MMNQEMLEIAKSDAEVNMLQELDVDHTPTINEIASYLMNKSSYSIKGNMSINSIVNKEILRLAAIYLMDYMYLLEGGD